MPPGYTGQILYVNLTELSTRIVEKDEYFYRTFMGGSIQSDYPCYKGPVLHRNPSVHPFCSPLSR